ncbi:mitochondrial carrier [Leucogyrophana mollusca]|uniref:Mitochondrial carrier n=1 Tax=Leucogyrophana mollusca TaxID=85980 RepID=A0ACB8BK67_9AGAM|nr:mitochondrial carrier [Leucogyrophana mollusca]
MDPRHGTFPEGTTEPYAGSADSPTTRAVKDIAFGSIAGMVAEVFEYPFDLAKVRLQSQVLDGSARFGGPLDCLMRTWRDEGVRGLYRGLPVPIFGSMAETAGLFVAYSQLQGLIRWSSNLSQSSPLSISQLGLAAGGAGFLTSFILTPIELIKCKMQVQMLSAPLRIPDLGTTPPSFVLASTNASNPQTSTDRRKSVLSPRKLPGPFTIISNIIRTSGTRGLWTGHTGTMIRETGGTAAWFASKEFIASLLQARRTPTQLSLGASRHSFTHNSAEGSSGGALALTPWESGLSGALAGGICVLALYPADTVKSAIQTAEELRPPDTFTPSREIRRNVGPFWGTATAMYRAQGWRGLYAGCGMTVARAIPCSGIVFVVYDGLNQRFGP